jgi:ABC-type transport system involved in multi-copper enzyme maturation permease subunit
VGWGLLGRLTLVELRRLLGRGVVRLVLILPILPVLVAVPVRARYHQLFQALRAAGLHVDRLWLAMLGSSRALGAVSAPDVAKAVLGLAFSDVASFAWLVTILFAALAFASDAGSGRLALVAVRPVTRPAIAMAKTLAATAVLTIVYLEAAAAAYASSAIVAGPQSHPWLMLAYPPLTAVASLPLLLVTGIIGLKLARPGSAFAAGLVVYFSLAVATALAAFLASAPPARAIGAAAMANALEPIHSYMLPRLALDAAIAGLNTPYNPLGPAAKGPTIEALLTASAASTAAATAALTVAIARYISRIDIRTP